MTSLRRRATRALLFASALVTALPACSDKKPAPAAAAKPALSGLEAPFVGAAQPKVDILAFVDFECSFCRGEAQTLLDMADKHKATVRVRFLNLPLDVHPNSVIGAKAAVAAHRQNAYLLFYKKMLVPDAKLSRESVISWAVEANLDAKKFSADLASPEVDKIVARDVALAKVMGVAGTPSFLVNGNLVQGVQKATDWDRRIAEESGRADALLSTGTKPESLIGALVASGNAKQAADYQRYVIKGEIAPEAPVPAKVARTSGVASAEIQAAAGGTGSVQVGEPQAAPGEDPNTIWRVAVRPDDPRIGPANAPVTLVIFEDMQCPFCAKLRPVLQKLSEQYKDQLRIVFKHNPLAFHKDAGLAAEALEAARNQGKFWEMHDLLLQSQDKLDMASLQAAADKLGLQRGPFDSALTAHGGRDRIEADVEQAAALGARGTPNLFINGRKLVGAKEEAVLREHIDAELKRLEPLLKGGAPAGGIYEAVVGKGKLLDSLDSEQKTIDLTAAATRGPGGAAIHIVTFQDFQCPFCANLDQHIVEIEKEFAGRVKVSWVDMPLALIHPMAQMFAEAGQEALKQGKFWEFHRAVMADNRKLDEAVLLERAKKAGLDVKALQLALKQKVHAPAVEKNRAQAVALGLKGTPGVFINGHQFMPQTGFSANTFRAAVRRLLGTR